jgi:UDP-N-acetylglucosamine 2-epimerase
LISRFAVLNFAPTAHAESNLLAENVDPETIHRVGNTVVDAVQMLAHTPGEAPFRRTESGDKRLIVVTAHRRENHGAPLERICDALRRIAEAFPDVRIVFPVHPNPAVRDAVHARLGAVPGIELIEPLPYGEFLRLVARCTLALTDSGGLQEEAPSLNKPVVVLREATERPELVAAGGARLVGSDIERIVSAVAGLLNDPAKLSAMTGIQNPFGDGQAARRIHETIRGRFGLPVPAPLGPYRPPPVTD